MCDSADAVWSKHGEANGSFSKIENHRGEAGDWSKQHADENDGKVLKRERNGSEGEWERNVSAEGYEGACRNRKDDFAGKRVLKRSGAVREIELRGGSRLHAGEPFALVLSPGGTR
jgi:hypothetical protein